ncbi:MAG: hypothetical protein J6U31_08595 [Bacteroidales bacterium]|nr:hypothetical protein [Bacteroidales bacterium]
MKQTYLQPCIQVVRIKHNGIICTSPMYSVSGNADLNYVGGGDVVSRSRLWGNNGEE